MPTPRGALACGVIAGKIYCVGGKTKNGDTGANEVYDPAKDTWKSLSPMPTHRDHLAVGVVGGKLYAIAGRLETYAKNIAVNEAYDPGKDSWEKRAPLPTPRSGIAGAVLGGNGREHLRDVWRHGARRLHKRRQRGVLSLKEARCHGVPRALLLHLKKSGIAVCYGCLFSI
jgi:hypothetical protein